MFSIDEIPYQNQQDCFTMFYTCLADAVTRTLGRSGEGVVRRAVQAFAGGIGADACQAIIKNAQQPNLKTLVEQGADCFIDPRFRFLPLRATEQELWLEIHTCPMADFWRLHNKEPLGQIYYEEFFAAYFQAFSGGVAQCNLSKTLTCRFDNHCRLSVYYRPANLPASRRAQVFTLTCQPPSASLVRPAFPTGESGMGKRFYRLAASFYQEGEAAGEEGLCAVALGLRDAAVQIAALLRHQAEARGTVADQDFMLHNNPAAQTEALAALPEKVQRCLKQNYSIPFERAMAQAIG